MPAPVSVIIPTLNAAPDLGPAIAALAEGLEAGMIADLVISDGGSDDGTATIAGAAGARLVTGAAGRGAQLARGVAVARGDWLLLLHADSRPEPGWTGVVRDHIAGRPDRAACFRLRFRAAGAAVRWTEGWANARSRWFGLPYGDQGLLIHKDLLARVGGIPDLPLMEDVALARALKGRIAVLPHAVTTSAARYQARGWLRQGGANLARLAAFTLGADPERLARRYAARGD